MSLANHLKYSPQCFIQLYIRSSWEWIKWLSQYWILSLPWIKRGPVIIISRWSLGLVRTGTVSSIFAHFAIHYFSLLLFLRVLVSWLLEDSLISVYLASGGTDLRSLNGANEIKDIRYFWGLLDLEACLAVVAVFRVPWICSPVWTDHEDFRVTLTALKTLIGTHVSGYRPEADLRDGWISHWCNHRVDEEPKPARIKE